MREKWHCGVVRAIERQALLPPRFIDDKQNIVMRWRSRRHSLVMCAAECVTCRCKANKRPNGGEGGALHREHVLFVLVRLIGKDQERCNKTKCRDPPARFCERFERHLARSPNTIEERDKTDERYSAHAPKIGATVVGKICW